MTVDECREHVAEDVVYRPTTHGVALDATIERVTGNRVYVHLWSGRIVNVIPARLELRKEGA